MKADPSVFGQPRFRNAIGRREPGQDPYGSVARVPGVGRELLEAAVDATDGALWSEVDASFRAGHLRLHVDGHEVIDERGGCFELSQGSGQLSVGEGFTGGLDELEDARVGDEAALDDLAHAGDPTYL